MFGSSDKIKRIRKILFFIFLALGIIFLFIFPAMGVLILSMILIYFVLKAVANYALSPFRFYKQICLNIVNGNNVDEGSGQIVYKNFFWKVIYGYLGTLFYYVSIIFFLLLCFSFRPYSDGYITKQIAFESGDIVVIKNNDTSFITTVIDASWDEENGTMISFTTNEGIVTTGCTTFDTAYNNNYQIRGLFVPDTLDFSKIYIDSSVSWVKYMLNQFEFIIF